MLRKRVSVVTVTIAFSGVGCGAEAPPPARCADARQAEIAVDGIASWPALLAWFKSYSACDDAGIAEGVDDRVVYLMIDRWEGVAAMPKFAATAPGFQDFVVKHVSDLASKDQIRQIATSAGKRCPSGVTEFCRAVEQRAQALMPELRAR